MRAEITRRLCCPSRECGGGLRLQADCTSTIIYRSGPIDEVREGSLTCSLCGRSYPIEEYVPSFEQIFPADLRDEADYWSRWYSSMWAQGYFGFFDLKAPRAPLITEGITVLDPSSLNRDEAMGTHAWLAGHPLIKGAEHILDVGCGTGWSSLYLARRGHKVIGFDPSAANMRLAKRYAISQGEYIEYLGAAIGYLAFQPAQFDAVFALHSLHHVPRLGEEMATVKSWLRDGGGIAIDEHIHTHPILDAMANEMRSWAESDVYPEHRTLVLDELEALPRTPSALEGAGSGEVVTSFLDHFALESYATRCVSLDYFSFIYYLSRNRSKLHFTNREDLVPDEVDFLSTPIPDLSGYNYAADVLNLFYRLLLKAVPEAAEYVTLVGRKGYNGDNLTSANQLLSLSLHSQQETGKNDSLAQPDMEQQTATDSAEPTDPTEAIRSEVENLSQSIYRKNEYIDRLEHAVLIKNRHIERLELLHNASMVVGQKSPLARLKKLRNALALGVSVSRTKLTKKRNREK